MQALKRRAHAGRMKRRPPPLCTASGLQVQSICSLWLESWRTDRKATGPPSGLPDRPPGAGCPTSTILNLPMGARRARPSHGGGQSRRPGPVAARNLNAELDGEFQPAKLVEVTRSWLQFYAPTLAEKRQRADLSIRPQIEPELCFARSRSKSNFTSNSRPNSTRLEPLRLDSTRLGLLVRWQSADARSVTTN